jgi:hypothetical protein
VHVAVTVELTLAQLKAIRAESGQGGIATPGETKAWFRKRVLLLPALLDEINKQVSLRGVPQAAPALGNQGANASRPLGPPVPFRPLS